MSIATMVYAIVIGTLIAVAAVAAERVCAILRVPRRGVWIAALALAAALPVWQLSRTTTPQPTIAGGTAGPVRQTASGNTPTLNVPSQPPLFLRLSLLTRRLDKYLPSAWLAASTVVLLVFCRMALILRVRRRTWPSLTLGSHAVLLAPDVGPAVVGWFKPRIVVPKWALSLAARERDLILRHEAEHISARDPLVLFTTGVLLVCFPWNAAFWWMARRLRLAIEVDCDARVVRDVGHAHEYGMLLVAVGERISMPFPLAASLADEQPFLARRIHAMTALRPKHPIRSSLPFAALAMLASLAAAQTPVPAGGSGAAVAAGGTGAGGMSARAAASRDTILALITKYHPTVLTDAARGAAYRVGVVFDASGNYVTSGVGTSATSPSDSVVVARATPSSDAGLDLTAYGLSVIPRNHVGATQSFAFFEGTV
jgi:bla regulator protein blaR1